MDLPGMLWEILVPATVDGKPIPVDYHQQWDEVVRKISGVLTIMSPAKGQWVCGHKVIKEPMIPCRILAGLDEMNQIIEFTLDHYHQEAVLAYVISSKVVMKYRRGAGSNA